MPRYAEPADMIDQYDERTLADLVGDDGIPSADLENDTKLLSALDRSSGRVDAALLVSDMYLTTDLAVLTDNSLALLKDITCGLAMGKLMMRRPEKMGSEAIQGYINESEAYLELLRKGERIFDLAANREAGKPTINGPDVVVINRLNGIRERSRGFYIPVGTTLPIGRGGF